MKRIISIVMFFFLLCIAETVYAAGGVSLSSNKSSVKVGEEFTISVSLSNATVASFTTRINVDTSKVEYVSGPSTSSFRNGRIIYTWTDPNGGESPKTGGTLATFKLKAKATGSAGFSVSGDFYTPEETAVNPIFSGTTVSIIEEPQPEPENPPVTPVEPNTPQEPSTPQEPEVPSNPQTPQTPGTTQNPATNPGGSSQGNTTLSGNNNLKSLRLDVEGLTPNFQKDIVQYGIVVNETITDIDVLAVAEDSNSNIQITGNRGLQMGTNTIQIIVTAQNGNKKTYTISVTKTEEAQRANSLLENLAIENVTLLPEFRYDITEYTAQVASTQESLNILAVPQRENARIHIEGQENLEFGENTITITVTAEDGITTKTYTIKAYRKTEEEEKQEEMNIAEEQKQASKLGEDRKTNSVAHSIMAVVITVGIAVVIGILGVKYYKENKKI